VFLLCFIELLFDFYGYCIYFIDYIQKLKCYLKSVVTNARQLFVHAYIYNYIATAGRFQPRIV